LAVFRKPVLLRNVDYNLILEEKAMASFCRKCGKPLGECACEKGVDLPPALESLKNRLGIGAPASEVKGCYERDNRIVPDNITGNDQEKPVRQYNLAILRTRLKFMRAEGRMQVTDQRVIFRAGGRSLMGRTTLQHEFSLDEVAGVEVRKDWRFSGVDLFFGLLLSILVLFIFRSIGGSVYSGNKTIGVIWAVLFGIAGVVPFFAFKKMFFVKMLACAASVGSFLCANASVDNATERMLYGMLGEKMPSTSSAESAYLVPLAVIAGIIWIVAWFLSAFKPNLAIVIKTKSAGGAVEICRDKTRGLFGGSGGGKENGGEFTGFSEVLPWKDTDKAIGEIGAMIKDIQQTGDFGVEKWKEN